MYWKKNQVFFKLLFRIVMHNKRLWFYLRQTMIGSTYACRIINLLEIIIMLFIRFVLNYSFVRKNLLMKIRLRKLSQLCFHQIGSWCINTVLGITNITQNSYMTSFRQRSIMNSLWEIITNILLVRLHCMRSTIVHRVKKRRMMLNHLRKEKQAQKKQIQRPKFRERKEIIQVPPLWWC
jgi:hypothetical protein